MVKRNYDGTTQLSTAFQPWRQAVQHAIQSISRHRARTILRIDPHAASVDDVNWAFEQGHRFHGKNYSGQRAEHLVENVTEWFIGPRDADRQLGWVTETSELYKWAVKRIVIRCRKNSGQWGTGVILSAMSTSEALLRTGQACQAPDKETQPQQVILAHVRFYDQRGGGVEIEIKKDKQGFSTTKRNKKRFATQQVVCQLEAPAQNQPVWVRNWLVLLCPRIAGFGKLRLMHNFPRTTCKVDLDEQNSICTITMKSADPIARFNLPGLASNFAHQHIAVSLGES